LERFLSEYDRGLLAEPAVMPSIDPYGLAATGLLFAPGAGITDAAGGMADPSQAGRMLPSMMSNIRGGEYMDAGLQGLGLLGDAFMAAGTVVPPLIPVGAAMKAPRAARLAGRIKPPTKTELDPMGYSKIKLDEPLAEMQYDFEPMSLLFPDRKIVKPESLLGKVALFGAGDRSGVGTLKSLSGQVFDEPVSALGGRDYQLATPYAWASDEGVISGLLARAKKAQEETGIEDVVLAHSTMNPTAVDFTDFNSAAVAEMLKVSKITKKDAKQFDDEIKKSFPSFPGVKSPKFREWMKSQKSGKTRATIIKEMDKDLWRSKGFPMVGKARYALTEKAQQDVPTFQTGLSFIPIDVASGAVKSPIMPHSTYSTAMRRAGDPVQLSGTIPNEIFYRDFFKTLEGATTKSGAPQPASMKQYTTRLNNPYQIVDQELVDTMSGLLGY
jgi:hypothetical protein